MSDRPLRRLRARWVEERTNEALASYLRALRKAGWDREADLAAYAGGLSGELPSASEYPWDSFRTWFAGLAAWGPRPALASLLAVSRALDGPLAELPPVAHLGRRAALSWLRGEGVSDAQVADWQAYALAREHQVRARSGCERGDLEPLARDLTRELGGAVLLAQELTDAPQPASLARLRGWLDRGISEAVRDRQAVRAELVAVAEQGVFAHALEQL